MNEKTAKLLRKYADSTQANLNELKRQWNTMDQFERRDFRIRMRDAVDGPAASSDATETESAE